MITAEVAHAHASSDAVFVASSIGLAVVGSFAALVSAIRIPTAQGRASRRWIAASAISLGGGAIWSMHFMGMLGYHVDQRNLVYNVPLTALSLVIAIGVSAIGLTIVGGNPRSVVRLVFGGIIAGLGVAAMHYTGMAAMQVGSSVSYHRTLAAASVGIAVVAALAALWLAFRVRTAAHIVIASIVMAGAVCGMHYTAMAATQITQTDHPAPTTGADPIVLSFPVMLIAFTVLALIIFAAFGGFAESGVGPLVTGDRHGHRASNAEAAGWLTTDHGREVAPPALDDDRDTARGAFTDRPAPSVFERPAPQAREWTDYPSQQSAQPPAQRQPALEPVLEPVIPDDDHRTPLYR
jgi:NO-binding membrane sensor protein with MHYT domain